MCATRKLSLVVSNPKRLITRPCSSLQLYGSLLTSLGSLFWFSGSLINLHQADKKNAGKLLYWQQEKN